MSPLQSSGSDPRGSASSGGFKAVALSKKQPRQVFVAYPYRAYPAADYRRVYTNLSRAFQVKFVFADEQITTLHILDKIQGYIEESQFGIYDISGWNANVTLELGLALGRGERAYIAIDPSKTDSQQVPSDLQGIDRLQYGSYHELENVLTTLLGQELPIPRTHEAENQIVDLRRQVLNVTSPVDGLKIGDIATALGISTSLAQVVVRPLVGDTLRTEGQRRGMRYFQAESQETAT
ncbi:hypothetical protein [Jannaschia sp. R86511]|uniref:hypothetical protein n=1 Tax=Jannaschia sp. R86511 TaxID=3093853 RepID=UPI0036D40E61